MMDESRFDSFARSIAVSRRSAVRVALGGLAAGLAGAAGLHSAEAKPKEFKRLGKRCDRGQPCGELTICVSGFCAPTHCLIGGAVYPHEAPNPDNPCQRCLALEHDNAWRRWSTLKDGATCPPPNPAPDCVSTFIATCQAGLCVPEPLPDDAPCGAAGQQVCCTGGCCAPGEVCDAGVCEDDGPVDPPGEGCEEHPEVCVSECIIEGETYQGGTNHPTHDCLWCNPQISTNIWSPKPDNATCGSNDNRVCCNGECCALEWQCCGEVPACHLSCFGEPPPDGGP